jgi:hypothetical protein
MGRKACPEDGRRVQNGGVLSSAEVPALSEAEMPVLSAVEMPVLSEVEAFLVDCGKATCRAYPTKNVK